METNCAGLCISVWSTTQASVYKAHSDSGCYSFSKWWGGARGHSCHLPFFTHWMVPHGNSSSAVLPVLWSSAGAKKWDRMCASVCVCVCVCTHVVPVICWWFTQLSGSHPGPIFSFSLHNSKRYYRCLVSCPFFSSSPSPFCFSATSCSFSPLSSTLLCVGDVTARHSLVLLYHPWDREVTGPEHTI